MSDTNAYVNAYIDNAIGMVHENVNIIIQLKTQLKIANDIILEKDGIIGSLNIQLQSNKNITDELSHYREVARQAEEAHKNISSKVSHMETALAQISQMKSEIKQRDSTIEKLEKKLKQSIEPLKESPKKTINTKKKLVAIAGDAKDEVSDGPVAIAGNATDDF